MTTVFVQNNTTLAVELETELPDHLRLSTRQRGCRCSLGSAENGPVLRFARRLLRSEHTYFLRFNIASSPPKPALELRLQPQHNRGRLRYAWAGQPWQQGGRGQRTTVLASGRRIDASCSVRGRLNTDLEVVLHDVVKPRLAPPNGLDVLVYNIWLRPWMQDGQKKRAALLGRCLGGHDVVVLAEAFHRWYAPPLLRFLAQQYPYRSRVLGDRAAPRPIGSGLKLWNGGVVILSKWPLENTATATFRGLLGMTDRMADKGVLYGCIRKHQRRYHLFATHTQADPEAYVRPYYQLRGLDPRAAFRAFRHANLRVIRRAIDRLAPPCSEPVLIAGDLNIDCLHEPGDYERMLDILNADGCREVRGHPATYCPHTNEFATGPREAWLDHVLWSRSHLQPTSWDGEICLMRPEAPWHNWGKRHWDLSDHYALRVRLGF